LVVDIIKYLIVGTCTYQQPLPSDFDEHLSFMFGFMNRCCAGTSNNFDGYQLVALQVSGVCGEL